MLRVNPSKINKSNYVSNNYNKRYGDSNDNENNNNNNNNNNKLTKNLLSFKTNSFRFGLIFGDFRRASADWGLRNNDIQCNAPTQKIRKIKKPSPVTY